MFHFMYLVVGVYPRPGAGAPGQPAGNAGLLRRLLRVQLGPRPAELLPGFIGPGLCLLCFLSLLFLWPSGPSSPGPVSFCGSFVLSSGGSPSRRNRSEGRARSLSCRSLPPLADFGPTWPEVSGPAPSGFPRLQSAGEKKAPPFQSFVRVPPVSFWRTSGQVGPKNPVFPPASAL